MTAAVLEPRKSSARKRVSRYAAVNAASAVVGDYDHPKTFAEFYEREPLLVRNWLIMRKCPMNLVADYNQELLMFLMRPVTNHAGVRFQDHIAYYQTDLMGGFGTKWAFVKHIFNMLTTEYPKLIKRFQRANTSGANILSISGDFDASRTSPLSLRSPIVVPSAESVTLRPLLTAEDHAKFQSVDEPQDPKLILDTFFNYLSARTNPNVVAYARACMVYDTAVSISSALGISRSQCRTLSTEMLYWAKKFRERKR